MTVQSKEVELLLAQMGLRSKITVAVQKCTEVRHL